MKRKISVLLILVLSSIVLFATTPTWQNSARNYAKEKGWDVLDCNGIYMLAYDNLFGKFVVFVHTTVYMGDFGFDTALTYNEEKQISREEAEQLIGSSPRILIDGNYRLIKTTYDRLIVRTPKKNYYLINKKESGGVAVVDTSVLD